MSGIEDESLVNTSGSSAPPDKRARSSKRPISVSPTKRDENLHCLPGGCCPKCKEEVETDSKAIQCDLCAAWIHATCKGLSDEMYDSIMVLGGLNNVLYYCDTNNCISRIKQLLFTFLNRDKLDKPDQSQPIVRQEGLSKQLDNLSQKFADLSAKQLTL